MAIRSKSGSTIQAKTTAYYSPDSFAEQKNENFIETTAANLLFRIKPKEFSWLPGRRFISVDTETYYTGVPANRMPKEVVRRFIKGNSGKYIPNDFPFCISICDGQYAYVVYDTLQNGFAEFKKLAPLLEDMSIDKMGHNLGFDMHMLANAGVNMRGRLHDTGIISRLVRGNAFSHKLIDIAREIGEPCVVKFEYMLDNYKAAHKVNDYRMFPRELMTQYTCADVWNDMIAFEDMYPRIAQFQIEQLYEVESEMLVVAYYMERTGIPVDKLYKDVLIPELENEVNEAERKIYGTAGCTFNINSQQQLYGVLSKLGYGHLVHFNDPTAAMLAKGITKGNPSFDKFEMERLENEGVPLIKDIQQFKASEKLLNTFARKLYEMHDFEGLVHCNINTIEAKTGRFSISAPSMQNMPRRKDSRVRGAFIALPGYTLYDFDFKSQESIILVHYSRSEYLLAILRDGKDIHKAVASLVYSVNYEDVSKALREIAKSVEFAIVYGAGGDKVASMTGLTVGEATAAMKQFLRNAPEVDKFIKDANKIMKERGVVRTVLGRHVYAEPGREYACVNYVCQGSAADSTKTRMVQIHKFLFANRYKTRMILQVHDSLLQMNHDSEKHLLGKLRWLQTERELFRVPVQVDVAECSPTWRDKKDIDVELVEPSAEEFAAMEAYDIWAEGLLSA